MKIYVLTSGEYSDYQIETVKISEDDAERLSAIHGWEIEEFDTDEITIPERLLYTVFATKKGIFDVVEGEHWSMKNVPNNTVVFSKRKPFYYGIALCIVKVEAKDMKSAEKIALDLIAKARYNKEVEEMEGEE